MYHETTAYNVVRMSVLQLNHRVLHMSLRVPLEVDDNVSQIPNVTVSFSIFLRPVRHSTVGGAIEVGTLRFTAFAEVRELMHVKAMWTRRTAPRQVILHVGNSLIHLRHENRAVAVTGFRTALARFAPRPDLAMLIKRKLGHCC